MSFEVRLSKIARRGLDDFIKCGMHTVRDNITSLLEQVSRNPWINPPAYEKLGGEMTGLISRRISGKHRFLYQVFETERRILVLAVKGHYEKF